MARITVEDCIDKFPSRFELVLIASNRARKLYSGEEPTVERDNDKNSVIALREIAEGTISAEDFKTSLIEEYQTVSLIDEEEDIAIENSNSQNEKEDDSVFKNSDNQEESSVQENSDNQEESSVQENSNNDDTLIDNESLNKLDVSEEIYKDTTDSDNKEVETAHKLMTENSEENHTVANTFDEENKNLE